MRKFFIIWSLVAQIDIPGPLHWMLTVQDLTQFLQYIITRYLGKLESLSKPFRWVQSINPVTYWCIAIISQHIFSILDFMTDLLDSWFMILHEVWMGLIGDKRYCVFVWTLRVLVNPIFMWRGNVMSCANMSDSYWILCFPTYTCCCPIQCLHKKFMPIAQCSVAVNFFSSKQ